MSKRTLLLADDSVTIQKVVNLTFADEGIEVVTVGDGDSAMERISQISPDVVLADVHMPGLSGYRICEILRQNPVTKDIPVVLLVGSFEPFDESEAARVGANAYLTKPFQSIRQLVSQVTDLMDASGKTAQAVPEEVEPAAADNAEPTEEKGPETNDIESLYHQSFSDTPVGEGEPEIGAAPRYVDAGMDDEMIETSFVAPTNDSSPEASREFSPGSSEEFSSTPSQEFSTDSSRELSSDPAQEFSSTPSHEFTSNEEARSHEFTYEPQAEEIDQPAYSTPEPAWDFAEPDRMERTQEFESFAHDRVDIASAAAASGDRTPEFDEFSNTDPTLETESQPVNQFGVDETEILELPPMENEKPLEFTTTQRLRAESAVKELVSLSPELMDVLVQKVVEKLSEK